MTGLALAVAGGVTLIFASVIVRTTVGRRFLDQPNTRSLHDRPVPRGGGVAIWCGVMAGGLALRLPADAWTGNRLTAGWLAGAFTALMVLGVIDDRGGLPAPVRFAVQAAVVGAFLVASQLATPVVVVFDHAVPLGVVAGPAAAVAILWMLNLYNFMDGMDGFAGSMTLIGFATMGWLAARDGEPALAAACALPAAAALGFLILNVPPARLFLGDSGSVPLGFLAGALALAGVARRVWSPVIPVVIFAPFVLDATATLVRRGLRGERVWVAHRTHVYQRLVVAGLGHRRTLAIEVLFMVAASVLALASSGNAAMEAVALAIVLAIYGGLAAGASRVEGGRPKLAL